MGTHPIFESDFDCLTDVKTLGAGQSRITENLKKNVGVFDPELPDYVVILLANGKPKSEVYEELLEFIPKNKLSAFVTWLYEEIHKIKEERKQEEAKTPPKDKPKKEKKAKKSKKNHVIAVSSDDELAPPPVI